MKLKLKAILIVALSVVLFLVIDSVVMPGAKIGKNVVIERAIVGSEMVIEDGTIIRPEKNVDDVVLIAEGK